MAGMASNLSQKGSKNRQAFIYCRISHDPSGKELGVARQEKDCRKLAKENGFTVVEVFTDNDRGASSLSKSTRPKFDEMMQRLDRQEADCVIVWDLSRLTRQPRVLEDLIDLVSKTDLLVKTCRGEFELETSTGKAMARMMGVFNAAESENMSERQKRAHRDNAEKGLRHSPIRIYGYQADKITADRVESEFVRGMIQRAIDGQSCTQIAKWLNES